VSTGDPEASHGTTVPALPPGYVPRARLLDKLAEGVRHPLTLVTGPPGSGKTVLVAGWARETAGPAPIWISLDSDDNDPSWFLRHLADAVGSVRPPLVGGVVEMLGRQGKASRQRRRSAGSGVTHEPVVFVFDDYHVLTASEVIETVSSLARALPSRVRVVICSRQDPRVTLGSTPTSVSPKPKRASCSRPATWPRSSPMSWPH
jgi:LuxR family transcriptional regulator, maltose regulon positive regulatory protein